MEVSEDVPFSVDDVDTAWVTRSLQASGLLADTSITDIDIRVLGDQVGFNGEVAIITPQYPTVSDDLPASMVLKIPTASKNRIVGQTMGLYEKEIRFYRDLQPELKIRTPRHYFSALDIADDPDVYLERLLGMNRLPIILIRGIMALATRFISSNPRKYALLIEDLSSFRMGDQTAGSSQEDISNIIATMARLHAQFWDNDRLKKMTWVAPYTATSRIMQMRYLQIYGRYLKEQKSNLSPRQLDMLTWLRENGINLTETYGQTTTTLLHGDFRLDNICFNDANGEVVLFDWQTLMSGPAGSDLAYFVSATLPADADETQVDELIDSYHGHLVAEGVTVTREHLRWQYEVGMLTMLHRLLPTVYQDQLELDDERGLPMLKAWIERIYLRLEHCDFRAVTAPAA